MGRSILIAALLVIAELQCLWSAAVAFLTLQQMPSLRGPCKGAAVQSFRRPVPRRALDLSEITVKELKDLLRKAELPVCGRKVQLVRRLEEAGYRPADDAEPKKEDPDEELAGNEPEKEGEPGEKELAGGMTPVEKLTRNELKDLLKKAKLPVTGRKAILVERLKQTGYGSAQGGEPEEDTDPKPKPAKRAARQLAKKKARAIFAIDEEVDGYSDDDERWFPAKVIADLGSGSFRVEWDEDSGTDELTPGYIRKRIGNVKRNEPFQPGEQVEAVYKEDGLLYTGILQQGNPDGTFTLLWDEDGEEYTAGSDTMLKVAPRMELSELSRGQKFKGRVCAVKEYGAFIDIGAVRDGVVFVNAMLPPSQDTPPFVEGDKVQAFYSEEEEWYSATVNEDNGDGTYTITWDNFGYKPHRVKQEELKLQSSRLGVKVGTLVDVWVQKVTQFKYSLTMYEHCPDPIVASFAELPPKEWFTGTIAKIYPHGAMVKVASPDGRGPVFGWVHISLFRSGFVEDPHSEVEVGQTVRVRVLQVDLPSDRLVLSMI